MIAFELISKLTLDISEFMQKLNVAKTEGASGFGNALGKAAKIGMTAIAGTTAALGAFAASSISAGQEFDKSMSQVAATMGMTMSEMEEKIGSVDTVWGEFNGNLRDYAQFLGKNTAFSATEAADALNYMALAGYDAQTSMDMLPNVLNLAAAGTMDLARASDMVTDTQTAFGISLDRTSLMVDEMAKAASTGNTSVEQLGEAFLTVGGLAQELNGGLVVLSDGTTASYDGIQELEIALTAMANAGIKGSEAGTHMRNMLLKLSSPTDAGAQALEKLGVSIFNTDGSMRSLAGIMGDMSVAMEDLTQEEKLQAIGDIFNTRDIAAAEALMSAVDQDWADIAESILDAEGSASQMAATQLDNLAGDITLFQSALEGAKIAVSDQLTPAIREFVQFGTDGISRLTAAFQEGGLEQALGVFGEIVTGALAMIIEMLPQMVDAGKQLLVSLIRGLITNLPAVVTAAVEIVTSLAQDIVDSIPELIPAAIETVASIVAMLIDNVPALVESALAIIIALAEGIVDNIPTLLEHLPTVIESVVAALINMAPRLVTAAVRIILALAKGLVGAIPQLVKSIPSIIKAIVNGLIEGTQDIRDAGKQLLTGLWNGINDKVEWLKGKVAGVVDKIKGWFTGKSGFDEHSPSRWAADVFEKLMLGGGEGLESGLPDLMSTVSGVVGNVQDAFAPPMEFAVAGAGGYGDSAYGVSAQPREIVLNLVNEIDGNIFARQTYRYYMDERQRRGEE